jgi:hypothetical protein
MAQRRLSHLFNSSVNYPEFHWNEGLSRAGRHYLNEMGSCGANGDIYGMGYSQILSAYYAWNVLGLDF